MNKKLLQFASMLLVAVCLCVNFTSCSDDDDEKEGNGGSSDGKENGYAYVDLGLPSGLKWATCNVGAENPGDVGDYFAWGETTSKDIYTALNSKYFTFQGKRLNYYSDAVFDIYGTCTKYYYDIVGKGVWNGEIGIYEMPLIQKGDGKKVLDPEDDAAHVNMGGAWRMPTYIEQKELRDNCYWEWADNYKGYNSKGYIVYKVKATSDKGVLKKSGETVTTVGYYTLDDAHIFLPAPGAYDWMYEEIGKKHVFYVKNSLGHKTDYYLFTYNLISEFHNLDYSDGTLYWSSSLADPICFVEPKSAKVVDDFDYDFEDYAGMWTNVCRSACALGMRMDKSFVSASDNVSLGKPRYLGSLVRAVCD